MALSIRQLHAVTCIDFPFLLLANHEVFIRNTPALADWPFLVIPGLDLVYAEQVRDGHGEYDICRELSVTAIKVGSRADSVLVLPFLSSMYRSPSLGCLSRANLSLEPT